MSLRSPTLPSSHVVGVAERIRESVEPLRIVGSGTWMHGGGPWVDASPLSLSALRGVVEYTPGDLVITVWAGTTLDELRATVEAESQMLALTPYGSAASTVGAMVATALPAPLAFGDYAMRDLVLGVQVVTGTGDITRAGGRVVKNVAGFDLVRLHTGAFGTLGAITEVSLRLHARLEVDDVVEGSLHESGNSVLDELLPRLVGNRAPLPLLLHRAPDAAPQLFARISGNAARARALEHKVREFGVRELRTVSTNTPPESLLHTPADAIVLRARTHRSDAVPFVRAAYDAFPHGALSYDPARGGLRAVLPAGAASSLERDIGTLYRLSAAYGAMHTISVVVDQGRSAALPFRSSQSALETGIKQALDPRDVLNRLAPMPSTSLAHADV